MYPPFLMCGVKWRVVKTSPMFDSIFELGDLCRLERPIPAIPICLDFMFELRFALNKFLSLLGNEKNLNIKGFQSVTANENILFIENLNLE